jgi:hypothetical protein
VVSSGRRAETVYTPTLGVGYGGLWGENYWYAEDERMGERAAARFVPREIVDRARAGVMAPDDDWNHFNNAKHRERARDAGVRS